MNNSMKSNNENEVLRLQGQVAELQNNLDKAVEALKIGQRRYEIAVGFSDVTVFDYNVKTRKILTQPADFEIFGMPGVLENGVESVISSGIIAKRSEQDMRELYRKIDNGAKEASATIYANDLGRTERTLSLRLVTIFDQNGEPTYAVGVRKDITDSLLFLNEKKYGDLMTGGLTFIYEANVTRDRLLRVDPTWAQEIGLGSIGTLNGVLKLMSESHISPEDANVFCEKQSPASILSAFEDGESIITLEYRKWVKDIGYQWFEVRINIVRDDLTGDVNMRVYVSNIDARKNKEIQALSERKRLELALLKSAVTYEVNITKNIVTWGYEYLVGKFDAIPTINYADSIVPVILDTVHPHDRKEMGALLTRDTLLSAFAAGTTCLSCEYRRINASEQYSWYRCSLRLFEETQSGDVLCCVFVEDINTDKERELSLLYRAQHDLMTGFYNKGVVAEKIDEALSSEEGKHGIHVFFIIDLDHFKLVNDNFGHAFGDAVLSQASAKIASLFRSGDILGRIGGDEFVVFMKNIKNENFAFLKAQELCDSVYQVYVQSGIEYKVSVSVGIAIYGQHGTTYGQLYDHSDTALYEAKRLGRNRFSIYNDNMQKNRTAINSIDPRQISETQTFESRISEYVFRILYEAFDKSQAINSVLELIGKHYNVSRVYVFENTEDNSSLCNTFEWCNQGVKSPMTHLLKIPYSRLGDYAANFSSEGIFFTSDINSVPSPAHELLHGQDVRSMVQFPILKNGRFAGFIGFDECTRMRIHDKHELSDYRNFANILGVFITEMRAIENSEAAKNILLSVINRLDSYAYVCDPSDYKILFANDRILEFSPHAMIGDICYERFWGRSSPCENCVMDALIASGNQRFSRMSHGGEIDKPLKVSSALIDWVGDNGGCLIELMDIAELQSK